MVDFDRLNMCHLEHSNAGSVKRSDVYASHCQGCQFGTKYVSFEVVTIPS